MGPVILTVTPNPAYDVTYDVSALVPGTVHRVTRVHRRPGGKGVNVAAVLAALGTEVVATGLADAEFAAATERIGIPTAFVPALPSVRATLAVVDERHTTSLWEPGLAPADPAAAVADLLARVEELLPDTSCLVVSGSLPPGVPPSLPAELARRAIAGGVPVIVDTSGEALRLASSVPGVVLVPNSEELSGLSGPAGPVDTVEQATAATRVLVERGARAVFATRGADGIVVTTRDGSWSVPAPRTVAGNPTGAGDAVAAAVARGLASGLGGEAIARDAVALGAAAVAAPYAGSVDPGLFEELRGRVGSRPS